MKLYVKVGRVELEYSESTDCGNYPKVTSKDSYENGTKSDRLLEFIKEMADKAAEIEKTHNLGAKRLLTATYAKLKLEK